MPLQIGALSPQSRKIAKTSHSGFQSSQLSHGDLHTIVEADADEDAVKIARDPPRPEDSPRHVQDQGLRFSLRIPSAMISSKLRSSYSPRSNSA